MKNRRARRLVGLLLVAIGMLGAGAVRAAAHPLGNFTVNQFARVEPSLAEAKIRYVVDFAEIPTLQERAAIDADGDGAIVEGELAAYAARTASECARGLALVRGGDAASIDVVDASAHLRPGTGGLEVLRVEVAMRASFPAGVDAASYAFENRNFPDRLGWREIVVAPSTGASVYDSSAFANSATDELRSYPEDLLAAPLDERSATFAVTVGAPPAGSSPARTRDGQQAIVVRDRLGEIVAGASLDPLSILFGLLLAAGLGAIHALTPGHGKTIVGAYLVGSRGTPSHALFLGLTVTITHTAGVFALGLVTLFASSYVLPEQLFPILSIVSGGIVLGLGLGLFVRRLRALLGLPAGHHHAGHDHSNGAHAHGDASHTHLPPGAGGEKVTWKSLLALGVSGGLLPCPSALVVLLAGIALDRIAFGLLLVVAFSIGLAGVLTGIGLAFVFAKRLVGASPLAARFTRVAPLASAAVIAGVGGVIFAEALAQAGVTWAVIGERFGAFGDEPSFHGLGILGILGLGLVYGLKHATEADHVVAVTTIVSEHRKLARAALVGGLWGLGHTASLVAVGAVVLVLKIAVPASIAAGLELAVALMIVGLGAAALVRGLKQRSGVHVHAHAHDGVSHAHIHFHDTGEEHVDTVSSHTHAITRVGLKPLLVGAMHGLAGSAALTLLVLAEIPSVLVGTLYLAVFGIGSVGGMMLMSGLVGVPFALAGRSMERFHSALQIAAGAFSIAFGIWYALETGALDALAMVTR